MIDGWFAILLLAVPVAISLVTGAAAGVIVGRLRNQLMAGLYSGSISGMIGGFIGSWLYSSCQYLYPHPDPNHPAPVYIFYLAVFGGSVIFSSLFAAGYVNRSPAPASKKPG